MTSPLSLFSIPLFYYFIVGVLLLSKIPVLGPFFRGINTAVHELGHALAALLLQGRIKRIELFSNNAGTTQVQHSGKFSTFLIAIAGYPFSSLAALFACHLYIEGYYVHLIVGTNLLFLAMLLLWIRNGYGILWVLLFTGINAGLLYLDKMPCLRIAALFYATLLLAESVRSAGVVLYLSLFNPKESGDAALLQKNTRIPAFFWGLLFAALAGWVAWKVIC